MAENDYGIWYMNNGQIDFGYNGFVKQRPYKLDFGYDYYDLYAVTGGKQTVTMMVFSGQPLMAYPAGMDL